MIFLTVGTQFPFERLVKSVDRAVNQNGFGKQIFAQIGRCSYQPQSFKAVVSLEKQQFDKYMREACCVISHAGMGTISMALDYNKPMLVMPRLKRYGEVVNDHQMAIARRFEELGIILVAYETGELPEKLKQLMSFAPRRRDAEPQKVAERIAQFLVQTSVSKKGAEVK